jgi:hypothetical protein
VRCRNRPHHDAFGKTLTVWLAEPQSEAVCEEADDDTVFMKDADGRTIGRMDTPAYGGSYMNLKAQADPRPIRHAKPLSMLTGILGARLRWHQADGWVFDPVIVCDKLLQA